MATKKKPGRKRVEPKSPPSEVEVQQRELVANAKEELGKLETVEQMHPLAVGIVEAKSVLSALLAKDQNICILRDALQDEFDESPTKFLRVYGPLLALYEKAAGAQAAVKSDVNVTVTQVQVQEKPRERQDADNSDHHNAEHDSSEANEQQDDAVDKHD